MSFIFVALLLISGTEEGEQKKADKAKKVTEVDTVILSGMAKRHSIRRKGDKDSVSKFGELEVMGLWHLRGEAVRACRKDLNNVPVMEILGTFHKTFPTLGEPDYYSWWLDAFVYDIRSSNAEWSRKLPSLPLRK